MAATGPGVTAHEVHVDVAIVDLAGAVGNAAFGIPANVDHYFAAVADYINRTGGVACGRQLLIKTYRVNPIDSNDQQSKCLQMVSDSPLLVIDYAGYITPVAQACFPLHHVPYESLTSLTEPEAAENYPYMFSPTATAERQVRNTVLGLAARGFFHPPAFTGKLGILEDGCEPTVNTEISHDLATIGIPPQEVSIFKLDCALVAPPNQIQQAVLQHKLGHADVVFLASAISNAQNYVKDADQQGYRPRYITSDYGAISTSDQPFDAGFDGALAVTTTNAGEINSGIHSPALKLCNSIDAAHGLSQTTNGRGGGAPVCDLLFLFRQAVNNAGANPTRLSLVQGVGTSGFFSAVYAGNGQFNRPRQVTGGNFQREIQYHLSCSCWKVVDRSAKPGY